MRVDAEGSGTSLTELTDLASRWALRVAFDGWRPTPSRWGRISQLTIGPVPCGKPTSARFAEEPGSLTIRMNFRVKDLFNLFNYMQCGIRGPTVVTFEGGGRLEARLGVLTDLHTDAGTRNRPGNAEVILYDWAFQVGSPILWVALVHGKLFEHITGNLWLRESAVKRLRISATNLRLEGNYRWTVAKADENAVAIIDPDGKPFERLDLVSDFCALQLAFGSRLSLGTVTGVKKNGTPVAWRGVSRISNDVASDQARVSPVPTNQPYATHCFAADFFNKVAKALRRETHESWVAFGTYMDALDEHLAGAYLKLQVALETLSHVVPRPDRAPLVAEPRKWDAWVTNHAEEIRAFGRDDEAATKLINKLRSAHNPPATDAVEDALTALQLDPGPEAHEELGQRNRIVHRFLMNRMTDSQDLHRDWQRVGILRVLLVAIFAKQIGYGGPILGWEQDASHHYKPAAWWKTFDTPLASVRFLRARRLRQRN